MTDICLKIEQRGQACGELSLCRSEVIQAEREVRDLRAQLGALTSQNVILREALASIAPRIRPEDRACCDKCWQRNEDADEIERIVARAALSPPIPPGAELLQAARAYFDSMDKELGPTITEEDITADPTFWAGLAAYRKE